MMTLKDIKVSRNHIPVQNALWLRPTGGLSFKIYYPHGREWAEMKINGSVDPEPPTPSEYQEIEEQIAQLSTDIEALTERIVRVESWKSTISELSKKVTKTERTANNANADASFLFLNSYQNFENPTIPTLIVGTNITEDDLPNHNTSLEILNAIAEMQYSPVYMYRDVLVPGEQVAEKVKKTYGVYIEPEEEGAEWTNIFLVEFVLEFGAKHEEFEISREKKVIPGLVGKHYVYNIIRTEVDPTPGPGPSPSGPTDPSTPSGPGTIQNP